MAERLVGGLYSHTPYSFRIVASNSYGTTTDEWSTLSTFYWEAPKKPNTSLPMISAGTATIAVPSLGINISCQENGSGSTGGLFAVGDEYNIELTKCSVSGLPECTVTVSPMHLGGNYMSKEAILTSVDFAETHCAGAFDMNLAEGSGFVNGKLSIEGGTAQSFALTDETKFGSNPVTITLNTTWELVNHYYFYLD